MTRHKAKRSGPRHRMGKAFLAILLLLLVGGCAVLYGLVFTTAGARWMAARLMDATPLVRVEVDAGRLWDGLALRHIHWHDDAFQLSIEQLNADWDPRKLHERKFRFLRLRADGVSVALPDADPPEVMPWFERLNPAARETIELPPVDVPLDLAFDDVRVRGIDVTRGARTNVLDGITLSGAMEGNVLTLRAAHLAHAAFSADLSGAITLTGDYPLGLRLRADIDDVYEGESLRVEATFGNHLAACRVSLRTRGLAEVSIEGRIAPLLPALPADIKVAWRELSWPSRESAMARSPHGSIHIDGALDGYRMTAAWRLEGESLPAGDWQMVAQGDWRQVAVQSLQGHVLEGTVSAEGDAVWMPQTNLNAHVQFHDLRPDAWFPKAPSNLLAEVRIDAERGVDGWTLDLRRIGLEAQWRDIPWSASGEVAYRPRTGWRLDAGRLVSRESELRLDAAWHDHVSASGRVAVADLGDWHSEFLGRLTGHFDVHGEPAAPDVAFEVTGENLAWNDRVGVAALTLSGKVADGAATAGDLQLHMIGLSLPDHAYALGDARIGLEGTREKHRLTAGIENGVVDLALQLEGGLDATNQWSARLESASVAVADFDWRLLDPPSLRWQETAGALIVSGHSWGYRDARLHVTEEARLGAAGDIALHLEKFDLKSLISWLPPELEPAGLLDALLTAAWGGDQRPEASLNATLDQGSVTLSGVDALDDEALHVALDTFTLESGLGQDQGWLNLDVAAGALGNAELDTTVAIGPDGSLGTLDGRFSLASLDVGVALPFVPMLHVLEGEVNARGQFAGELRNPRIEGEVTLAGGAVESVGVPVSLRGINLALTVDGQAATLRGDLQAGEGQATLSGEADWSNAAWEATLSMQGKDLELVYDAVATLHASPDIQLRMGPDQAFVSGRIEIPRAQINLKERPETAVRTSPDTVFVDQDAETPLEPRAPGVGDRTHAMEVRVVLGKRVAISGYGLTGRLAGDLEVQQAIGGVPQVFGEVRIVDGEYRAYGRRLTVREGRFLFAGPVDQPDIYIEAVRHVPAYGVEAGLRVEGRPDNPRMTLFAEPALPEEEALSFLMLGRPLTGADDEGLSMLTMAALSMGVGGGLRLGGVVEEFGVEDVHVDTAGTGEDMEVVVSGRVGPRLDVSYGVGVFAPTSRLKMRYRLTKHLYLEAVSSAEDAIDIIYTFSF